MQRRSAFKIVGRVRYINGRSRSLSCRISQSSNTYPEVLSFIVAITPLSLLTVVFCLSESRKFARFRSSSVSLAPPTAILSGCQNAASITLSSLIRKSISLCTLGSLVYSYMLHQLRKVHTLSSGCKKI